MVQTAKGRISNCNALTDLLESVEQFVDRVDIYTRIPSAPKMDEIVVKILVAIISVLALVTEKLKERRSCESVQVLADVLLVLSTSQSSP